MTTTATKHPCPDCRYCQWCGDDRCRLCRRTPAAGGGKLSMAEQIARYEAGNRKCCCGSVPSVPPAAKS